MSAGPSHGASFDEDGYARPNQPFRCGWADEGHACPLGPTKWGFCRSARECAPYKQGDTWLCARTKASGGPCEEGPLPDGTCCSPIQRCQPVRNVLSKRGLVSLFVFALAVGVGFIMLGAPNRSDLVSPGELSIHHRQVAQNCQDCHVGGDGRLSDWIHTSFDAQAAEQQGQLCLNCHRDLGEHALQPHGVPSGSLEAITERLESADSSLPSETLVRVANGLFGTPADAHGALACATCHKEHHGNDSLTRLTDRQCQTCHTRAFDSFEHGHPDFDDYASKRRTRIHFDHATHYGRHFQQSGAQSPAETAAGAHGQACSDCHVSDSSGRFMLVRAFEQTCANCHQEQIQDDTLPGLAVLSLPALDLETLQEKQVDIGEWPDSFPLHVEASGQFTPIARLLMFDAEEFSALDQATNGLDLSDLSGASEAELQAVGKLVWLFKEMLHDTATGGHPELQRRMAKAFAQAVPESDADQIAGAIPVHLLGDMHEDWLPGLHAEVQARRGEPVQAAPPTPKPEETPAEERARLARIRNGWYLHPSSLALRYRPSGHADGLLKLLLDATTGALPLDDLTSAGDAGSAMRDVYRRLASPYSSGRCTKCHSVDSQGGEHRVNWRSYLPPLDQHDFTKFNHAPHVSSLDDDACTTCHVIGTPGDDELTYRPAYHRWDWMPETDASVFQSSFPPPLKSGCVQCHAEQTSRDSCLTCHNYHVR